MTTPLLPAAGRSINLSMATLFIAQAAHIDL